MFKSVLSILCLALLAVPGYSNGEMVKHVMLNDANLIETAQGSAINSPNLAQIGFKTASIKGDNVILTSLNCQQTVLSRQQLSNSPDLENILSRAKAEFNSVEIGRPQLAQGGIPNRWGVSRFSLNDQTMSSSFSGRNMNSQTFQSNGLSMIRYDDTSAWLRGPNMPNNINRIFVSNDVAAFIYNTGEVQMKPVACLQPAEQQLVSQVRTQLAQAHGQFRQNMRQFQQNMQYMQQNLQNNMQNMQQNINQNMQNLQSRLHQGMSQQGMFGGYGQSYNPYGGRYQQQGFGTSLANGGDYSSASSFASSGGQGAGYGAGYGSFGQDFPFGTNNNPFGQGFPFNG